MLDFDGTIVRLKVDWPGLSRALSQIQGRPCNSVTQCLRESNPSRRSLIFDMIRRFELSQIDRAQPNMKIINFIKRRREFHYAVLSNNMRETIETALSNLSIRKDIQLIVSAEDVQRPKPDPDGVVKVLEFFSQVDRSQVLLIGDRESDLELARTCGISGMLESDFVRMLNA